MTSELIIKIIVCILAGLGAGVGTGFVGLSAVSVIGPVVACFLGLPVYATVAIGLASDVLASLATTLIYKKNKNLDIKDSWILLLSVLVFTILGSFIGKFIPNTALGYTTEIALILVGLKFVIKPLTKEKSDIKSRPLKSRVFRSIVGGAVVGLICGTFGAGGGVMMLMVLTAFLGYEIHMAVGTSTLIMTLTALTGGVSHFLMMDTSTIDMKLFYLALGVCVVSTLVFALLSSLFANKVSSKVMSRIVGGVLMATGILVLVFRFI